MAQVAVSKMPSFLSLQAGLLTLLCVSTSWANDPPSNLIHDGIEQLATTLTGRLKSPDQRWRQIAVLPFEALDKEAAEHRLERISSELLSARLSAKPGLLLVERARIDSILKELKRKEAGEIAPNGAANLGRLLGASSVVLGTASSKMGRQHRLGERREGLYRGGLRLKS